MNGTIQIETTSYNENNGLICWKTIFAGLLITFMTYMILTALGAAIGGSAATRVVAGEEGAIGLASGAGLWLALSAVVSLFIGSYFSLRISKFVTGKVGTAHAFVVASIFFLSLALGGTASVALVSKGIGKMVTALGTGASDLSKSPLVQNTVQKMFAEHNLKSSPQDVSQNLALFLIKGDVDAAKNYFAYEAGVPRASIEQRFDQMKGEFDVMLREASERVAATVSTAGWSLFSIFVLGLSGAVMGGRMGAHANLVHPLSRYVVEPALSAQPV